jgi:hypothetical protein
MSVTFFRGQQLGRNDLSIFLDGANGSPQNAAEITYALYDFTTGAEVLLGSNLRVPQNPSVGEYFASIVIPLDANLGTYRIRWTLREYLGGPVQQVVQEFAVIDRAAPALVTTFTTVEADLIRRLRILTRDNNPDRNYHFRPPAHEETINQFNRVFGYIWEDDEMKEYLERSLDTISLAPPFTPFNSLDTLVARYPAWRTLLLTGAMIHALQALRLNWIADEFDYSIGGVSLTLDKSSKYEGALSTAVDQFDKQLEKAKATINIIIGVQQPKYGVGIRSAFGPYVGRGVLSPRKFVGL